MSEELTRTYTWDDTTLVVDKIAYFRLVEEKKLGSFVEVFMTGLEKPVVLHAENKKELQSIAVDLATMLEISNTMYTVPADEDVD